MNPAGTVQKPWRGSIARLQSRICPSTSMTQPAMMRGILDSGWCRRPCRRARQVIAFGNLSATGWPQAEQNFMEATGDSGSVTRDSTRRITVYDQPRTGTTHDHVLMVPVEGIEPTLCCQNRILSPARLPVPPHRPGVTRAASMRREWPCRLRTAGVGAESQLLAPLAELQASASAMAGCDAAEPVAPANPSLLATFSPPRHLSGTMSHFQGIEF